MSKEQKLKLLESAKLLLEECGWNAFDAGREFDTVVEPKTSNFVELRCQINDQIRKVDLQMKALRLETE